MPQSHAQIYLHLVFSTKHREPWLNVDLFPHLHEYMGGLSRNLDATPIRVGGVTDHVHILSRFPRTLTVSEWVEKLKTRSNRWIKPQLNNNRNRFAWQSGYGVFSVSPAHVDPLVAYIDRQEEHHRKETFQDEMRRLYRKYQIAFDEQYVWD